MIQNIHNFYPAYIVFPWLALIFLSRIFSRRQRGVAAVKMADTSAVDDSATVKRPDHVHAAGRRADRRRTSMCCDGNFEEEGRRTRDHVARDRCRTDGQCAVSKQRLVFFDAALFLFKRVR